MIVDNIWKSNDIVTMKLVNGDETVCRILSLENGVAKVKKPMIVALSDRGVGLVPYTLTSSAETVYIKETSIMSIAATAKPTADSYIETTTGLKV